MGDAGGTGYRSEFHEERVQLVPQSELRLSQAPSGSAVCGAAGARRLKETLSWSRGNGHADETITWSVRACGNPCADGRSRARLRRRELSGLHRRLAARNAGRTAL